ncbi:MAG TPA: NUDIX hydrolase [Phycisphaerales bacterium]|nr:NUDIX hydrolase [Phycisphaerales bacterium]HMP36663.1 NUDIX hydrolase [Phycisphaerales bacterium]
MRQLEAPRIVHVGPIFAVERRVYAVDEPAAPEAGGAIRDGAPHRTLSDGGSAAGADAISEAAPEAGLAVTVASPTVASPGVCDSSSGGEAEPRSARGGAAPVIRDIVRHPGAVAVVAALDDGRLVLVRNFRVAVDAWLVELCAGKLESGEEPADAARRELEEETGYAARSIVPMGSFYTSPGFADERMHLFAASGLTPVPQRLERGEQIEVVRHTFDELLAMIDSGELRDGKTIAGLMLWSRRSRA